MIIFTDTVPWGLTQPGLCTNSYTNCTQTVRHKLYTNCTRVEARVDTPREGCSGEDRARSFEGMHALPWGDRCFKVASAVRSQHVKRTAFLRAASWATAHGGARPRSLARSANRPRPARPCLQQGSHIPAATRSGNVCPGATFPPWRGTSGGILQRRTKARRAPQAQLTRSTVRPLQRSPSAHPSAPTRRSCTEACPRRGPPP